MSCENNALEGLRQFIPMGEFHLRRLIEGYTEHYHLDRPHQGLENRPIKRQSASGLPVGEVRCGDRLGDLLRSFHRIAA